MPVVVEEDFAAIVTRMKAAKPELARKHLALLEARYDLSNRPAQGVTMFRGKPIQTGVRAKLTSGMTWDSLGQMTPEQVLEKNGFPEGFMPLPPPHHAEGGMVFPKFHIDEIKSKRNVTSPALILISTYRSTSCPSFLHRSSLRRGPI